MTIVYYIIMLLILYASVSLYCNMQVYMHVVNYYRAAYGAG